MATHLVHGLRASALHRNQNPHLSRKRYLQLKWHPSLSGSQLRLPNWFWARPSSARLKRKVGRKGSFCLTPLQETWCMHPVAESAPAERLCTLLSARKKGMEI